MSRQYFAAFLFSSVEAVGVDRDLRDERRDDVLAEIVGRLTRAASASSAGTSTFMSKM